MYEKWDSIPELQCQIPTDGSWGTWGTEVVSGVKGQGTGRRSGQSLEAEQNVKLMEGR